LAESGRSAEAARPGNGASVLDYVRNLDRAFAIPIASVTEYPGMPAGSCGLSWALFTRRRDMCGLRSNGRCSRCARRWLRLPRFVC
jgi:hypothetical protein